MSDENSSNHMSNKATSLHERLIRLAPVGILVLGLAVGYALGLEKYLSLGYLAEQRQAMRAYVDGNAVWSALLFVGAYILAVAFSFPAASVLTIFGGFLFGWLLGGALVAVGATIGASILFLATRSAFGASYARGSTEWSKSSPTAFAKNAFSYLFVIRLAPVFPFFVVNIAAALFDISLGRFVAQHFSGFYPAHSPMPISAKAWTACW